MTPTAGTIYTIHAMQRDPVSLNTNLGYHTNFLNLLDYTAVAVPAGFQTNGLPFGASLIAQAHEDVSLLNLAGRLQQASAVPLGATGVALGKAELPEQASPQAPSPAVRSRSAPGWIKVAVCGAHLSGLPLNGQLISRSGRLVAHTTTSPHYKLYALPGDPPQRPGLVHVGANEEGAAIQVEVWELPASEFGGFVAGIPAPVGIGTITLADSYAVQGFLCECHAVSGAMDISHFGGWRGFQANCAKESKTPGESS